MGNAERQNAIATTPRDALICYSNNRGEVCSPNMFIQPSSALAKWENYQDN